MEVAIATNTKIFKENQQQVIKPKIIEENERISQLFELVVEEGAMVEIEKFMALYTSKDRGISETTLAARHTIKRCNPKRFNNYLALHQSTWQSYWERADIQVYLNNEENKKSISDEGAK